jgi:hypothetical protein
VLSRFAGGVALACGLAAFHSPAEAQGYGPYIVMPPGHYGYAPPGTYGLSPPGYIPRPPRAAILAPGHVVAILRERHGFAEIGRPERDGPVYLVEAIDRRGVLVAIVIDAIDGEVLSRDAIGRAPRGPRAAVTPPRDDARLPGSRDMRPGAKIVTVPPQPPQRPAGLVAKAPEAPAVRAPAAAPVQSAPRVYPPPVDPRLSEKLGAK